jgi:ABC-type molybdenum transport system ATPase subunit/photorepair protein PhrA
LKNSKNTIALIVGIDGPMEELVRWLLNTEQKLKVISIVGFGGLGKTTLAKEVYQMIGKQFDCKAFVSVSQRPDLKRLLKDIQSKLGIGSSSYDAQDILDSLVVHLNHKR